MLERNLGNSFSQTFTVFHIFLTFLTALSRYFLIMISHFFWTPVRQKLDLLQTRYKPEKMVEVPPWRDKLEPLVRLKKKERERERESETEKMEKYHNCTSRENIIYRVASISTVNLVSGMLLRFKNRHCGFKVFPRHLFLLFYLYLLRREEKKNIVIATRVIFYNA